MTEQIVAASQRQCTCSQRREHLAVTGREEHRCTGQPPYSPDLAHCDFFLFPKLNVINKGDFEDVETINRAVTFKLRDKQEESFQQCIKAWQIRM